MSPQSPLLGLTWLLKSDTWLAPQSWGKAGIPRLAALSGKKGLQVYKLQEGNEPPKLTKSCVYTYPPTLLPVYFDRSVGPLGQAKSNFLLESSPPPPPLPPPLDTEVVVAALVVAGAVEVGALVV